MEDRIAHGEDYSKVSSQRGDRSTRSSSGANPALTNGGARQAAPGQGLGPETDLGPGLEGTVAATWGFAGGGGGSGGESPSNESRTSRSSAGKSIHTTGGGAGGEVKLASVPHTPMAPGQGLAPGPGAIIRGGAASSSQGQSRNHEIITQGGEHGAGGGGVGGGKAGILRSSTAPLSPTGTHPHPSRTALGGGSGRNTARGKENNTRDDPDPHPHPDDLSLSQMSRNSGLGSLGGSLSRGASVTFSDQNYAHQNGLLSQRGEEARGQSALLNRAYANANNKTGGGDDDDDDDVC